MEFETVGVSSVLVNKGFLSLILSLCVIHIQVMYQRLVKVEDESVRLGGLVSEVGNGDGSPVLVVILLGSLLTDISCLLLLRDDFRFVVQRRIRFLIDTTHVLLFGS